MHSVCLLQMHTVYGLLRSLTFHHFTDATEVLMLNCACSALFLTVIIYTRLPKKTQFSGCAVDAVSLLLLDMDENPV